MAEGKATVGGVSRATMAAVPLGEARPLPAAPKPAPVRPVGKHFADYCYHYLTGRHRPGTGMGELATGALIAIYFNAGNEMKGSTPEEKATAAREQLSADGRFEHDQEADSWRVKPT